ncbi:MAG: precorrin-8X methylmutase [Rhodobacteraceae bacterium]|nr:precorrin-8X methylmutase [Paracoccaceae bacterium]
MTRIVDPEEIVRKSFAHIRSRMDPGDHSPGVIPIIERVVHAAGMLDLVDDVAYSDDFVAAGQHALIRRCRIYCDSDMVAAGLTPSLQFRRDQIRVMLDHADVDRHAREHRTTRSAAAIDVWQSQLGGAIIVIGNAPTALFKLLDAIRSGAARPAVIIGITVWFVGAAESKEALIRHPVPTPYFTVRGTRGGSAMAAAAMNALVRMTAGQSNASLTGAEGS